MRENKLVTQSVFLRVLVSGFGLLLLNSIYVAALPNPSLWYFVNVGAHPALGLVLAGMVTIAIRQRRWKLPPVFASGLVLIGLGCRRQGGGRHLDVSVLKGFPIKQ